MALSRGRVHHREAADAAAYAEHGVRELPRAGRRRPLEAHAAAVHEYPASRGAGKLADFEALHAVRLRGPVRDSPGLEHTPATDAVVRRRRGADHRSPAHS